MKVLLIKPPIRGFMHEIGRHVPIGLAYLSSVLRRAGHETILFDALAYTEDNCIVPPEEMSEIDLMKVEHHPRWRHLIRWGASPARIEAAILEAQPDVVGISCMFSPFYETAYEVARLSKKLFPDAKVVLGGPHATVAYDHALRVPEIDLVVIGEAESNVVSLLENLVAGKSLLDQEGLAFRCDGGLCNCQLKPYGNRHVSPKIAWLQDLDGLPFPAADQLDFERYGQATTLITSRGCPFSCTFCTVHATVGKKFRARTPANVVDEIEQYIDNFGIRRFLIEDDNFTFDIDRVFRLCREVKSRGLDIELNLPNGITVVKLDEELVRAMTEAGFRKLFLGLETTDTVRLTAIAKRFTSLAQVERGAAWFSQLGADVSASLIVGLPGQSLTEVIKDVTNLLSRGIQFWSNPFYPIPGSPDYRRCLDSGLINERTEYSLFDQYNFSVGSDILSPAELYWTWIATQAVAQWTGFVGEGCGLSRAGKPSVEEALQRLMAHTAGGGEGRTLEVPAVPVECFTMEEGVVVETDEETCFCTTQNLNLRPGDRTLKGVCQIVGDVIATALTIYTGQPLEAEELVCRLGAESRRCRFLLREREAGWYIQREFIAGIDSAMRESGQPAGSDAA